MNAAAATGAATAAATTVVAEVTTPCPIRRGSGDHLDPEEVLAGIQGLPVWPAWPGHRQRCTLRVARRLLAGLQAHPGSGWQQRWTAAGVEPATPWEEVLAALAADGPGRPPGRLAVKQGLMGLLLVQAILPGYGFLAGFHAGATWYGEVRAVLAPTSFARLIARADELDMAPRTRESGLLVLSKLVLHTGLRPEQIGVADFDELIAAEYARRGGAPTGAVAAWDLVRGHGIPAGLGYREHQRVGQQGTAEMVDTYQLRCREVRDVLVRYLEERRPGLDFKSFRNLVGHLIGAFWKDIETHHPTVESLQLPDDVAEAWKQRLRFIRRVGVPARPRRNYLQHLMQVRAFYLDIQEWAHQDPSWAPYAVPCPIRRAETRGVAKQRKRVIAAVHQRIRERLPRLPLLVETAEQHHRVCADLLAKARAVAIGEQFEHHGRRYRRVPRTRHGAEQTQPGAPRVEDIDTGATHDLLAEEDDAFWAWAVVEVLRHTGLRLEELLELTHLALVHYRLDDTNEVVPLLQIVPSKTDQERLLLVSPELASVLAVIINRLRAIGGGTIPVIHRFDHHELTYAPALPYLFQRRSGHRHRVISVGGVQNMLNRTLARAGLCDTAGNPLNFTPHDFRRIFATEAVTGGLPVHITARLLGHARITSSEAYVAVFQEDLIRTYRSYLAQRRTTRPAAEYREPTNDEWREFQDHFALRKLELGTCARPYKTPCRHEHACVRCPMLRVDPKQRNRLAEIAQNLRERIAEARTNGWHGEIEGLRISLRGAEDKLIALDRLQSGNTHLGLPHINPRS